MLELLAKGLTNPEIARILEIAPGTAKNHVAAVLEALEVTNRTEAAVLLADWAAAGNESSWAAMTAAAGEPSEAHRMEGTDPESLRVPGFGDRPAIAVLPFDDWSEDPSAFFAEGLSEDLITRLAAWRWFPVIARNSSFGFAGKSVDVRQVSRRLGARYVIEGSVRVEGKRARVTAQLLDGPSAEHIWADRWDVKLDEVFEAQDEIVGRIVGALEPALGQVEKLRALSRPVETLSAWEAVQRGLHHLAAQGGDDLREASVLFARAVELDGLFAPGHWGLSLTTLMRALYGHRGDDFEAAGIQTHGKRAVELDPIDSMAHLAASAGRATSGDLPAAIQHLDQSIGLNPSSPMACAGRAWLGLSPEQSVESARLLERAHRLSPLDPMRAHFLGPLALIRLGESRFDEALQLSQRAAAAETGASFTYEPVIACCLAHLGRESDAREAGQRLLAKYPGANHAFSRMFMPAGIFDLYDAGLKRAGVELSG